MCRLVDKLLLNVIKSPSPITCHHKHYLVTGLHGRKAAKPGPGIGRSQLHGHYGQSLHKNIITDPLQPLQSSAANCWETLNHIRLECRLDNVDIFFSYFIKDEQMPGLCWVDVIQYFLVVTQKKSVPVSCMCRSWCRCRYVDIWAKCNSFCAKFGKHNIAKKCVWTQYGL